MTIGVSCQTVLSQQGLHQSTEREHDDVGQSGNTSWFMKQKHTPVRRIAKGQTNGKTILILGAGQIGEACALRLIPEAPASIIVHCLTEEEATGIIRNLRHRCPQSSVDLVPSWGDALVTRELMHLGKKDLLANPESRRKLIEYYYGHATESLLETSSLYHLLERWRPEVVIDAINTATVVGYQDDPYSLPRKITRQASGSSMDWQEAANDLLATAIIAGLVRFTQSLQHAVTKLGIDCYVKISTTGLGGMGVNLHYTHGDVNEPGMSSGILGKVAAAGVMHQLFWSLSHTPGINIKIIVPAALVGWQGVHRGEFRSHGKPVALIDNSHKYLLVPGQSLMNPASDCIDLKKSFEMPYVDSGENCAYSCCEMAAITALGQMECVTREEVAQAAFEAINGSTRYDLLTAMDHVSLGPSYVAAVQRHEILSSLRQMSESTGVPSIATNNLGPTVSKHLYELRLIHEACGDSFDQCLKMEPQAVVRELERLIDADAVTRSHILSLGLPVILEGNRLMIGTHHLVPKEHEDDTITRDNIDRWADSGWVDLRRQQVAYWQQWLGHMKKHVSAFQNSGHILVMDNKNYQSLRDEDYGEVLAFIYSLQNGGRRVDFSNTPVRRQETEATVVGSSARRPHRPR